MKNRKKNKYILLLILLLGITIGYALLSTTLKINGTSRISRNTWSVYWSNIQVTEGSVTASLPEIGEDQGDPVNTKVTWQAALSLPGDFYEFTVDATNNGTIDAMIEDIIHTVTPALPSYIKYEVTYADGTEIERNHLLPKKTGSTPTTEKYKVRIEFLNTVTPEELANIPDGGEPHEFTEEIVYRQADDTAEDPHSRVPVAFATDDWDLVQEEANRASVQTSVTDNKCGVYNIGDTREIDMGDLGTHTIRIANCSTPAICNTPGFSQSACGFVVEFADVINPSVIYNIDGIPTINGNSNTGGWEYSNVRAYLNNGIYKESTADEADYTNSGIYSKLPQGLRDIIDTTTVVSGHGPNDSANFTTQDKIYLLATHEIYEVVNGGTFSFIKDLDTGYDYTRQLDYYETHGVTATPTNSNYVVKQDTVNDTSWWTRSLNKENRLLVFYITPAGGVDFSSVAMNGGISPAFRIQ